MGYWWAIIGINTPLWQQGLTNTWRTPSRSSKYRRLHGNVCACESRRIIDPYSDLAMDLSDSEYVTIRCTWSNHNQTPLPAAYLVLALLPCHDTTTLNGYVMRRAALI